MFRGCHSVEVITEHRHFYQQEIGFSLKKVREAKTRRNSEGQQHHQKGSSHQYCHSSDGIPQFVAKGGKKPRGLEVVHRSKELGGKEKSQQLQKQQKRKTDLPPPPSSILSYQSLHYVPETTRQVHDFFEDSFIFTKNTHQQHHPKEQPATHLPHSVIARQRHPNQYFLPKENGSLLQSNRAPPCQKPNLSISFSKEEGKDEVINSKDEHVLQRTRKRQAWHDPRHSEKTTSRHNSHIELPETIERTRTCNLKNAYIFEEGNFVININQAERKESGNALTDLPSPLKPKRLLYDAKSIISREDSISRLSEFIFDESILVERDLDMFSDIAPIGTGDVSGCEMARAFDRRQNCLMILKMYKEGQGEYQNELELMQLADGLSSVSGPLKILKFREVLTEDISDHKNIILVFESFERSLAEEISLLKSKGLNLLAYMDRFFTEIRELLLSLSRNGIKQKRTLKLEEFVQVGKDWKLHSLTGFSLDMGGSVCVREEWLEELRCEFRRIIG